MLGICHLLLLVFILSDELSTTIVELHNLSVKNTKSSGLYHDACHCSRQHAVRKMHKYLLLIFGTTDYIKDDDDD